MTMIMALTTTVKLHELKSVPEWKFKSDERKMMLLMHTEANGTTKIGELPEQAIVVWCREKNPFQKSCRKLKDSWRGNYFI